MAICDARTASYYQALMNAFRYDAVVPRRPVQCRGDAHGRSRRPKPRQDGRVLAPDRAAWKEVSMPNVASTPTHDLRTMGRYMGGLRDEDGCAAGPRRDPAGGGKRCRRGCGGVGSHSGSWTATMSDFAGVVLIMIRHGDRRAAPISGWATGRTRQRRLVLGEDQRAHLENIRRPAPAARHSGSPSALERFGTMRFADVALPPYASAATGFRFQSITDEVIEGAHETHPQIPKSPSRPAQWRAAGAGDAGLRESCRLDSIHGRRGGSCSAAIASPVWKSPAPHPTAATSPKIVAFHKENDGRRARRSEQLSRRGRKNALGPSSAIPPSSPRHGARVLVPLENVAHLDGIDLAGPGPGYAQRMSRYHDRGAEDPDSHRQTHHAIGKSSMCRSRRCWHTPTAMRRGMIDPAKASPTVPQSGTRQSPACARPVLTTRLMPSMKSRSRTRHTRAVRPVRNAFSATPSRRGDEWLVVPGTGTAPSSRGMQSWTDPAHPHASRRQAADAVHPTRRWSLPRPPAGTMPFVFPLYPCRAGGDAAGPAQPHGSGMTDAAGDRAATVRLLEFASPPTRHPHAGRMTLERRFDDDNTAGRRRAAGPWG